MLIFTIIVCTVLYMRDIYRDRSIRIIVHAPTPLFATVTDAACYGSYNATEPRIIRWLAAKEAVQVRKSTIDKDYWAFYLQAENGERGWVIFGQDGIEVLRRHD